MDYLYAEAMHRAMEEVIFQAQAVQMTDINDPRMHAYLVMTSISLQGALRIYGEKVKHEHIQG